MADKYIIILVPSKLENKFENMLNNFNRLNNEAGEITITAKYEEPEYVVVPKKDS